MSCVNAYGPRLIALPWPERIGVTVADVNTVLMQQILDIPK